MGTTKSVGFRRNPRSVEARTVDQGFVRDVFTTLQALQP